MTEKEKKNTSGISRRDFLKDAGLLVGGTAIGSTVLLAACGGETVTDTVISTKTVTTTTSGGTATVTTTAPGETQNITITKTVEVPADAVNNIVSLTVNGKPYDIQVKPNETLQDILRNKLGLKSPKDMCFGYGACGSCSVILDGRPVLSCMVLAAECNGVVVETAEGIAETNPALTEAYVMNYTVQCGYCTPGFFVTAKALLDHNPQPTEEDIREALAGNMCRCGTYPQHIKAVLQASS